MKEYNTTSKYQVKINGEVFNFVQAGAAAELKFNKDSRHLQFIEKKIESGSATDKDMERYDEATDAIMTFLKAAFRDGSKDNAKANEWIDNTSLTVSMNIYADLSKEASQR